MRIIKPNIELVNKSEIFDLELPVDHLDKYFLFSGLTFSEAESMKSSLIKIHSIIINEVRQRDNPNHYNLYVTCSYFDCFRNSIFRGRREVEKTKNHKSHITIKVVGSNVEIERLLTYLKTTYLGDFETTQLPLYVILDKLTDLEFVFCLDDDKSMDPAIIDHFCQLEKMFLTDLANEGSLKNVVSQFATSSIISVAYITASFDSWMRLILPTSSNNKIKLINNIRDFFNRVHFSK